VQIKRLVVGKDKTTRRVDAEEWTKEYYKIEAAPRVGEEPNDR